MKYRRISSNATLFFLEFMEGLGFFLALAGLGFIFARLISVWNYVKRSVNFKKDFDGANRWAIVTGATDGIGYEFALQLAEAGFNICAISRSEDKLKELMNTIRKNSPAVSRKYVVFDFLSNDSKEWDSLKEQANLHNVGILVNNVGINQEYPEFFENLQEGEILNIIQVNVCSLVRFTRLMIPVIEKSDISKQRLILNMGSFAGNKPTPLLATYSGAKSFMKTWSISLNKELQSKGIHVEHLSAYYVASKMSKLRRKMPLVPDAKTFVKFSLKGLGKYSTRSPFLPHAILECIANLLPDNFLINKVFQINKTIRSKALKRKA